MKRLVLAALLMASTAVAGEVGVSAKAQPEDLIVFSDQIRMGARVIFDKNEALADEVDLPSKLRLEVGFMTDKAAGDQAVKLRCEVRFVAPDGAVSDWKVNKICYEGNLAETAGEWTLIPLSFKFIPEKTDLNGASGVEVQVTDEVSGLRKVMMPTYGWMGGK